MVKLVVLGLLIGGDAADARNNSHVSLSTSNSSTGQVVHTVVRNVRDFAHNFSKELWLN